MKKASCLILSLLIFCQYGICGDVPEHLREIYGEVNPCDDTILNSSLDEIKGMDEREYTFYKTKMEKCENYRKALLKQQNKIPPQVRGSILKKCGLTPLSRGTQYKLYLLTWNPLRNSYPEQGFLFKTIYFL